MKNLIEKMRLPRRRKEALQAVLEIHVLDNWGECMECHPRWRSPLHGCETRRAIHEIMRGNNP